ncbi:MAG: GNAT family N-acetyltransferase [Bacteroidota bacterium]|nr:GNAT family N-acetyltransferase [Bacteroidota bacterium]
MAISIQPVTIQEAAKLSELAISIYKEHYLHLWNEGGAEWYMYEFAYAPSVIRKELEDKNNLYFFLVMDNIHIGYLKLKLNANLHETRSADSLELERIYIHQEYTGRGLGKQMLMWSEAIARQHHKKIIFLKAMDSSADAIRFYRSNGYEQAGYFQLPIPTFQFMKEEFRGMIILKKDLC